MNNYSTDVFVKSFTHLKGMPHADRALPLLQRIASLVKPIMRKHDWVLPVLAEFFPDNDGLLGMNVNGGQKILIRLRPARARDTFYEDEDLIGTMLHELTHNVHGPHDEKFYKLLASLEEEYYALRRSGYAGEGFHSEGKRLGLGISHDLPPHLARAKALEAAEKRRLGGMMGSGGKLGGGLGTRGLTPRELAARAAERRVRDEKSCGSQSKRGVQREADKAAEDSIEDKVIDLTGDSDLENGPVLSRAGPSKQAVLPSKRSAEVQRPNQSTLISSSDNHTYTPQHTAHRPPASKPASTSEWSCLACTLLNAPLALQCDACHSSRPSGGWICLACGETGISHDFWTCTFCGTVKLDSSGSDIG